MKNTLRVRMYIRATKWAKMVKIGY